MSAPNPAYVTVEVFCRCDQSVAAARYLARTDSRGVGHVDDQRQPDELWNSDVSEPMASGSPVIEVDTDIPVDVAAVVQQIHNAVTTSIRRTCP